MVKLKQVKISIKGGKVSADFAGFAGQDCKTLEDRIRIEGLRVEETVDKPELYHQTSSETNKELS